MSKLSDHIDDTIGKALRHLGKDVSLDKLDDKSVIALGVGLNDYMRKNIALNAARRAASTIEGAEAYSAELGSLQAKAASEMAESTGVEEPKLIAILGALAMAGSRYQPNLMELKSQLVGELATGRSKA